jgi:choline dehydrogenase-like flavoprotein
MAEAARRNFEAAEGLLGVVSADRLQHPLYSTMQRELQKMLMENLSEIGSAESCSPASLAVGLGPHLAKFSVPTRLLRLTTYQRSLTVPGPCVPLHVLTNRTVTRLILEGDRVTALDTSRGRIETKGAEIVLAMGTIPATTLLLNSLPQPHSAGTRYTAHFTSLIVARVPRREYDFGSRLDELELAAIYMRGRTDAAARAEYHAQLTVVHDRDPIRNAEALARYVPDPMATATLPQLAQSTDHLVFIVAVLGELDDNNPDNCLRLVEGTDLSTNVALSVHANDHDHRTWQVMDQAAFEMLEIALSPRGRSRVEYWHGTPDNGSWQRARPVPQQRRLPGLVHEASTLWVGEADDGVVGLDYRPQCLENVYVTGGSLWPTAGSFNPTLTMVALAQDLADQLSRRRLKQS